jgi:hypothetical protein
MIIEGEWQRGDDGVNRPVGLVNVCTAGGALAAESFLVDSGADRTVFSASLLNQLGLPTSTPGGLTLGGIGGTQAFVQVNTALELVARVGGTAVIRGDFAAFTDPGASDCSIIGRDVLNNFDVIVSRRRNEVLLLAAPHVYRVEPP